MIVKKLELNAQTEIILHSICELERETEIYVNLKLDFQLCWLWKASRYGYVEIVGKFLDQLLDAGTQNRTPVRRCKLIMILLRIEFQNLPLNRWSGTGTKLLNSSLRWWSTSRCTCCTPSHTCPINNFAISIIHVCLREQLFSKDISDTALRIILNIKSNIYTKRMILLKYLKI